MLRIFFTLVLIVLAAAELPSYFSVCGRQNPALDNCVKERILELRPKLRDGMPELDTPSIEPLSVNDIKLADQEASQIIAKNVKLYGLSDLEIQSLHMNLEKKTIDAIIVLDKIRLTADCDVSATLVLPVSGSSPINLAVEGVSVALNMKYEIVKHKGSEHAFFTSTTTKLIIKDYSTNVVAKEDEESPLTTVINTVINGNRKEIINVMIPPLEKDVSEAVLKITNGILGKLTYEEVLPDRE